MGVDADVNDKFIHCMQWNYIVILFNMDPTILYEQSMKNIIVNISVRWWYKIKEQLIYWDRVLAFEKELKLKASRCFFGWVIGGTDV